MSRGQGRGQLRDYVHTLRGVVKGACSVPCFCSWLFRSGCWVLVFLYLLSRICPNCACTQLFLVPYSFFVFCCSRRCLSRCKHSRRGSQVPACLITFYLLLCQLRLCKAVTMQSVVGWFEQPCSLFLLLADTLNGLTVQRSVLVGVVTVKVHT